MLFSACTESIDEVATAPEFDTFSATANTTRTDMGNDNSVLWNEGDLVSVFNKTADNLEYEAVNINGSTATLKRKTGMRNAKTLNNNYAIYPYDAEATLSATGVLSTSIAANQTYNAEADLQHAVMVAKSENTSFLFSNATSLLRCHLNTVIGGTTVTNIKVVSTSKNIAGKVTIDMADATPAAVIDNSEDGKVITLDCGDVALTEDYTIFNIALAANTFSANELKIVYTVEFDGDEHVYEYPISSAITFNAGAYKQTRFTIEESFEGTTSPFTIYANNTSDFIAAIDEIEDGGTIVLNSDVDFTTENRTHNGGNWYEGIYYVGDKDITIDLGGKAIGNADGAVNDYMLLFKNDGTKDNTITIKNGTIDAGTAAYCAICTSTTNSQKITINLENVEIINNNSNGAAAKIRGGAVINIKAGTKITGKDSYSCIEVVGSNTVANIYDGAEFYQNGTSSYVGSLIGASSGATINVYGGKGVSKKCGLAVYTSGGTINAMGGEWTGNSDGTVPTPQGDNNCNVLLVQNHDTNGTSASIMNVSGGTYKGGFSATGYTTTSQAELNISGGNFNADPSAYVENGKTATESNGTWSVQ